MTHRFYACLIMVAVYGNWTNSSACAADVVVKGRTLDDNGAVLKIDQINIHATDNKSGSVIPKTTTPNGQGGYTLTLQDPPGPFTVYGSAKIDGVFKYARSGELNAANKNPVDRQFLTQQAYIKLHSKDDLKKHLNTVLKILPKDHPSKKPLQEVLDAIR